MLFLLGCVQRRLLELALAGPCLLVLGEELLIELLLAWVMLFRLLDVDECLIILLKLEVDHRDTAESINPLGKHADAVLKPSQAVVK